ncbi:MAG: mercuric reductase, partial [Halothiobacillaceae bacterium]
MKKTGLVILLMALITAFFVFDLDRALTFEALKQSQARFAALYAESPWLVAGGFFTLYVVVTALSLPGAVIMTLAGGALFGVVIGTVLISFASTIGATLAFLVSRYLLRDTLQRRFGDKLTAFNNGILQD